MANPELIKKLREMTSCGISDCNKALNETNDDLDGAIDWLRKKGLSSAAKKSARITSEGVVCILNKGDSASMVEINSETDFVARNEQFQKFARDVVKTCLTVDDNMLGGDEDIEKLKATKMVDSNETVAETLTKNIATIGENINIRRARNVKVEGNGLVVSYVHGAVVEGMGKIGVLLALKSEANKEALAEIGKQIAMHIAATKPDYLSTEHVSPEKIAREKSIFQEQAKQSGKPDSVIEKMVEGRIRKFYEDVVLLEQIFVMENDRKVHEVLAAFEKEHDKSVVIQDFALFVLGDGIDKEESNLADEVASMLK